jgi:hypothetical protein
MACGLGSRCADVADRAQGLGHGQVAACSDNKVVARVANIGLFRT